MSIFIYISMFTICDIILDRNHWQKFDILHINVYICSIYKFIFFNWKKYVRVSNVTIWYLNTLNVYKFLFSKVVNMCRYSLARKPCKYSGNSMFVYFILWRKSVYLQNGKFIFWHVFNFSNTIFFKLNNWNVADILFQTK